jgi:arabinofuranosyltransferase
LEKSPYQAVLFLIVFALLLLAYLNRFVQDDAFISFRYADNLVSGLGLVWNEGEAIEGYTNFLWTLLMSVPIALGIDVVAFSYAAGLLLFLVTLHFTYHAAVNAFESKAVGLLTIVLLGTNYTFSIYATGGLETQLQASLFSMILYVLFMGIKRRRWGVVPFLEISVLAGLAAMTRLDSAVFLILIGPLALFFLLREPVSGKQKAVHFAALALPFFLLIGGWFLWKLSYYGNILPNTFYAKVGEVALEKNGIRFLGMFFLSYWLLPFPLLALVFAKRIFTNVYTAILSGIVLLWLGYIVKVGGDFMEFRFLVPVLPFAFMLIAWLIVTCVKRRFLQVLLAMVVIAGSVNHALTFDTASYRKNIETRATLYGHIIRENENWDEIGRVLGRAFGYNRDVTIAVTAAGATPYYSKLRTLDMLGLNDAWIAKNGDHHSNKPGHYRIAPLSYMKEQRVNLVIGHPWMEPVAQKRDDRKSFTVGELYRYRVWNLDMLPPSAKMVGIPIDENWQLYALYLTQSPIVDEVIRKEGWKTYPVVK